MAGPWEQFKSEPQAPSGPWNQFKSEPVKMAKIGAEGFADHLRAEVASRPVWERMMAGGGTVVDDAALRLKQLVTGGLGKEDVAQVKANRVINQDPAALGGSVLGTVGALGPMGISSIMGNAALGGGLGFFGTPVVDNESGVNNAAFGAVAGGLGGATGKLLTGSPLVKPTEQTSRLLKEGIVPTIGQNASSSPSQVAQALGRFEEKAASLPVVGDFITGARRRALGEFNRAAINKAAPGIKQIGKDGVEEAVERAGAAFDDVYQGAKVGPSDDLAAALLSAQDKPAIGLSEEAAKKYDRIIDRLVTQRLKPDMDAGLVKKTIESDLGKEARNLKFSSASDDRALGEALMSARDAIRDVMQKAVGPEKAGKLADLNRGYAAAKTVEKASDKAMAQGGVFTPYQLQRAAGDGLLRPLADDAQAVLASRVPNSGTADRILQGGIASGQFPSTGTLGYLGGTLATSPVYSRLGSRFLLGDLTPEQLRVLAPYLAQGARGGLYGQQ
jgi:hypothetical protein